MSRRESSSVRRRPYREWTLEHESSETRRTTPGPCRARPPRAAPRSPLRASPHPQAPTPSQPRPAQTSPRPRRPPRAPARPTRPAAPRARRPRRPSRPRGTARGSRRRGRRGSAGCARGAGLPRRGREGSGRGGRARRRGSGGETATGARCRLRSRCGTSLCDLDVSSASRSARLVWALLLALRGAAASWRHGSPGSREAGLAHGRACRRCSRRLCGEHPRGPCAVMGAGSPHHPGAMGTRAQRSSRWRTGRARSAAHLGTWCTLCARSTGRSWCCRRVPTRRRCTSRVASWPRQGNAVQAKGRTLAEELDDVERFAVHPGRGGG